MHRLLKISLPFLALLAVVCSPPAGAAPSEKRLALVIGNASYKAKALATPVNDAALIAQTLQAAGFDVMGARDLDGDLLRQTFRDFVDSVAKAGPDAVAAVYFAGYGLQLEGENYLVPIDADITDASDVPLRALRLSEQTHALAALHLKTTFIILDVARTSPFVMSGQPPASGLAWVEPETNMLMAFNAAPGTVSPDNGDGYGPYAKALAEMIREGGLTPAGVFDRVRLRVNELTKGAQVPWDTLKIETPFMFFERGLGAPPRADSPEHTAGIRFQPMRSLGAHDAYMVALLRDTFDAYTDFLADYWHDPMTKRIRAILAARREAITWRRTYQANVPNAYWSYLERYPRGPHVADARRLLAHLGATIAPPSKFAMMEYDVPPPLPDELEYIERTVLVFDDPAFAFESPQPSPVHFLEPPPPEFQALVPPAAPAGAYILPAPMFVSLPVYIGVPADVVAPPNSLIFNSAHKTLVINNTNNLAASPRLPPSVELKATLISRSPPPPALKAVASKEIKAPPRPTLPEVSFTPESKTPASPGIDPHALTTDSESSIAAPTILAPPPTGLPLRTRRAARQSPEATGSIPLPNSRPVTLAPPPTGMPLRIPRVARPSPQTTGSIPQPNPPLITHAPPPTDMPLRTPRAASLSPPTTDSIRLPNPRPITNAPPLPRIRSKPITQPASITPPPIKVDQAAQPTPLIKRRVPNAALGVSPPKPQTKPCPIVNGIATCS
jgi:uncharacterized caspase-like protein